jgi:hypothetical protein
MNADGHWRTLVPLDSRRHRSCSCARTSEYQRPSLQKQLVVKERLEKEESPMKSPKKNNDAEIGKTPTRSSIEAHDLTPSHATLITSRRDGDKYAQSLYEGASGQFFVHRQDENGHETITPVSATAAGEILVEEMQSHMSRIYRKKLEAPAKVTIDGKKLDTTKDELLWMNCEHHIEAGAVYRTAEGVEYLRLVNWRFDDILLFDESDWEMAQESVVEWLADDRGFLTLLEWPHSICFEMDWVHNHRLSYHGHIWTRETDKG